MPAPTQAEFRKIFLRVGTASVELEGEHLSLNNPGIFDLLTKVFAAGMSVDPEAQAKIGALTTALKSGTDSLATSVAANQPQV